MLILRIFEMQKRRNRVPTNKSKAAIGMLHGPLQEAVMLEGQALALKKALG
jgi:hypothetical protein